LEVRKMTQQELTEDALLMMKRQLMRLRAKLHHRQEVEEESDLESPSRRPEQYDMEVRR
jgi:ribosomal protein L29